jgi:tripartite ATP-independent transporter DctP family solute receptor
MLKSLWSIIFASIAATMVLTACNKIDIAEPKLPAPNKGINNEKTIILRLAENQPEDYPTTLGDREFARLVEERTQGRIKIEVYSGGRLGNEKAVTEQVQFAAVDLARVSISSLTDIEKSMAVLMLPYIYRDREHMFKVLEGPIGVKVLANLERSAGIVGLAWMDAGTRSFYNTKREINKPEDLIGLKIRTQETELMTDIIKAFGASPVAMAYGDVYSALQTGVVDGAENNWPSFEASRHYEIAKFFTVDEHNRIPELIVVSQKVMEKLSPEHRNIVIQAAKEAAVLEREEWLKREAISRERIESAGVKITTLQSSKEFEQKTKSLYDKYASDYKNIIKEIIETE